MDGFATLCFASFAWFWIRASFWVIRNGNSKSNCTVHWYSEKWTQVWPWKGSCVKLFLFPIFKFVCVRLSNLLKQMFNGIVFLTEICETRKDTNAICIQSNARKLYSQMFAKWVNPERKHGRYFHVSLIDDWYSLEYSMTKILFHYRAAENSFVFLRKSDGYGKLFSIVPYISEWFPELSGYNACRESSLALYEFSKVAFLWNFFFL